LVAAVMQFLHLLLISSGLSRNEPGSSPICK
jgi:hypothetical protein